MDCWVGLGRGTLLGPEGSSSGGVEFSVVGFFWSSLCWMPWLGLMVLVGLLFEIWIVDASIMHAKFFCVWCAIL